MTISSSIALKPGDMLMSSVKHSLRYVSRGGEHLLLPQEIVLLLEVLPHGVPVKIMHGENVFRADIERLYSSFVLVESNT